MGKFVNGFMGEFDYNKNNLNRSLLGLHTTLIYRRSRAVQLFRIMFLFGPEVNRPV